MRSADGRADVDRLHGVPAVRDQEHCALEQPVDADFLAVREFLRAGRELDDWLRRAVLSAGDRETLWARLKTGSGRDGLLGWKRFLAGLDYGDARRPEAAARLTQLRDSLDPCD